MGFLHLLFYLPSSCFIQPTSGSYMVANRQPEGKESRRQTLPFGSFQGLWLGGMRKLLADAKFEDGVASDFPSGPSSHLFSVPVLFLLWGPV